MVEILIIRNNFVRCSIACRSINFLKSLNYLCSNSEFAKHTSGHKCVFPNVLISGKALESGHKYSSHRKGLPLTDSKLIYWNYVL